MIHSLCKKINYIISATFLLALLPSLALALDIPADANRNFNPAYLSTSVACGSVQCAVHFQRAAGDPDKGDISVIVDVKDSVPSKDPYYNEKKFHGSATVKAGKDATVMATGLVPSHQYALKLYSTGHSMTNMFKDSYVTISTTSEAMPLSYSVAQPDFSGATKNAKDPYASGKISVSSPAGYAAFNDPSAGFRVSLEYMPGSDASFPPMRTLTSSAYLTNGRDGKSGINPDGTYFFELQPPLAAGADYSVRQTVVPPAGAEPSGPQVSVYHFNTESGFAAPGSDAEKQKYNIRMYRLLVPLPGLSYVMNPDLCAEERSKGRALPVCSADEFVAYALKFLVGVTAVMLVLRLMLDGYNMVTSDVPFLRASAKGSFNESLGGLMLVLCSYLILNTVNPDLVNPGINVGAVTSESGDRFTEQEAIERSASIASGGKVPAPLTTTMKEGETRNVLATCYFVANENEYSGAKTSAIKDSNNATLTNVSSAFYHHLAIEGTGLLSNGKLIGVTDTKNVQSMKDWINYKFGYITKPQGAFGTLETMRSIAVNKKIIAPGSTIYIPSLAGKTISYTDNGIQKTFKSDGIWYAKDVGGTAAISGDHIDLFTGYGNASTKAAVDGKPFCSTHIDIQIKKRGV